MQTKKFLNNEYLLHKVKTQDSQESLFDSGSPSFWVLSDDHLICQVACWQSLALWGTDSGVLADAY